MRGNGVQQRLVEVVAARTQAAGHGHKQERGGAEAWRDGGAARQGGDVRGGRWHKRMKSWRVPVGMPGACNAHATKRWAHAPILIGLSLVASRDAKGFLQKAK